MVKRTSTGIAYDDRSGEEPALLFLPGWCGPRTLFDLLAARLDGQARMMAVDWRGHGQSAPADKDFGTADPSGRGHAQFAPAPSVRGLGSLHEWGTRPEAFHYQVWGPNTERQT